MLFDFDIIMLKHNVKSVCLIVCLQLEVVKVKYAIYKLLFLAK